MKRIIIISVLVLISTMTALAQKIVVKSFALNPTSLIARTSPVKDNAGVECAVVRLYVRDTEYEIDGNQYCKKEVMMGEIRLWVPEGTKSLTIRHSGVLPLRYKIPIKVESKKTYEAIIDITQESDGESLTSGDNKRLLKWFGGVGFNVMAISGPSVMLGIDVRHHQIEVAGVFGLNATDDLYFYTTSGTTKTAYSYKAMRGSLRYGYDFSLSEMLHLLPQVGVAFQSMTGTKVGTSNTDERFKNSSSTSALLGARLMLALGKHFSIHVTPEYDFCLSNDGVGELISKGDDTFKSWTEGFCLNAGILINF